MNPKSTIWRKLLARSFEKRPEQPVEPYNTPMPIINHGCASRTTKGTTTGWFDEGSLPPFNRIWS